MNTFGQTSMTKTILQNGYKFQGDENMILGMFELLKLIEGKKVVRFEFPPLDGTGTIFVQVEPFGQEDIRRWSSMTNSIVTFAVTPPPQS